jgi:hypothetical protein
MTAQSDARLRATAGQLPPSAAATVEVSIVIPCLNEADTLETCLKKAQRALSELYCMEFATEMILKATLFGAKIAEVPLTLHPDGRKSHAPH